MTQTNTIHSHFVLPLLRNAESKGFSSAKILKSVGLSPEVIEQPDTRFTLDQYTKILRSMWKSLNDEFFGLTVQNIPFGTFSLFCELALKENTVGGALQKQADCFKVATNDIRWDLSVTDRHAFFNLIINQKSSEAEQALTEYLLSMTFRFSCWLAGENIPLSSVWFDFEEPDFVDEYQLLFGCPCLFGKPRKALKYPVKVLSLPNVRTKKELLPMLRSSPAGILINPITEKSLVLSVRQILLTNDNDMLSIPGFETVAELLSMSPGTLRRRLRAENTSYQALKDEIRRDIATEMLANPRKSIFEVACAVGFSEASTFSRAFSTWTGLSPTTYRKQTMNQ